MKTSVQYKLLYGLFKAIGVNKMLDKEGPGFFDAIAPVLATGDEVYLLSPLLYDLTGFPETDVFYGTREVMIAYLRDFQAACKKYGVKLHTHRQRYDALLGRDGVCTGSEISAAGVLCGAEVTEK